MKRLIQLLVSAPTETGYAKVITAMKVVLRSENKEQLRLHFDANRTNGKSRWSSVYCGSVTHMGNHTNNRRVYCFHLFWQTVNERSWARGVNRVGVLMNLADDDELNELSNLVSRYAIELAPYDRYADPLRALAILQTKKPKVTVCEKRDNPPHRWIAGTQVALFQN
ncbi:hypothetical protein PHPALM_28482 [Phytophthora palmivora]|uniref:Uncharacterized protein n=1 Tax=Phytophthora palmivora TaxID=4796 RepID=A0A2P4XA20_9STRA|nr:hypothetical protein PHPALM_28482 [Phytophthora palmivora]